MSADRAARKREYNQRYYVANRDRLLGEMRKWREANPDYETERWPKRKAMASEYKKRRWAEMTAADREQQNRRILAWKAANPEKAKALERRRLDRIKASPGGREKNAKRMREWRAANPDKAASARDRRRAREVGAEGEYTSDDIRDILKVQGRVCYYCPEPLTKFERDHFIPLARGGSNSASNIVLSCPSCNYSKGAKLPWEWKPERFAPGCQVERDHVR